MQGKSNNLRVVEDGKQSQNIEAQPTLTHRSQFYDRRSSLATLVHQPQNKITYLLVDLCLTLSLFPCSPYCEISTCPCLTVYTAALMSNSKHNMAFVQVCPAMTPSTCQLLVRSSHTQERLNLLNSSEKRAKSFMLVNRPTTRCK